MTVACVTMTTSAEQLLWQEKGNAALKTFDNCADVTKDLGHPLSDTGPICHHL